MGQRSSGGTLIITSDTLSPGIDGFDRKLQAAIAATCRFFAPQVEGAARQGATWTDRTSAARNGLSAEAYRTKTSHGIILSHSVPYGIWLEVRWNGKYRIIVPTILEQGDKLMRTLQGIVGKL